jgi:hypothetical protein
MLLWICNTILALCAFFFLANWAGLLWAIFSRKSFSFAPPLLAGVVAIIAMWLHPDSLVHHFAWMPLLADPSITLALVGIALTSALKKWRAVRQRRKAPPLE